MSLQGIQDAITLGTNSILTSSLAEIESNMDKMTLAVDDIRGQFAGLTNQSSGVLSKVNVILDKIAPIVDDINALEKSVGRIVDLLYIIAISIAVIIFFSMFWWFFRHVWPLLRGFTPRPRSFDDLVRELTISRAN